MFYNKLMFGRPSESEGGVDTNRLSLPLLAGRWSALNIAVFDVEANSRY